MEKQYIYIAISLLEPSVCKIGMTYNLDRQPITFSSNTDKSKEISYQYVFVCDVVDMIEMLNDIKENFFIYKLGNREELYFYNEELFEMYIEFIKSHPLFEEVIFIKKIKSK